MMGQWVASFAKRNVKQRISRGLWAALRLLRDEISMSRLHRQGVTKAAAYRARTGLKLHIGCGQNHKEGWVNIDLLHSADLPLDMRERIPLPDNSAAIIYSEHFFEHLDYPGDAERFLAECYRLLQPGGIFSVGVPDTKWPLQAYAGVSGSEYFEIAKKRFHPPWCQTPLEHINYHFRQGTEHRYAYDYETLSKVLAEIGFRNIEERKFDDNLDSERRKIGTLYVNAIKSAPEREPTAKTSNDSSIALP